MTPRAMRRDRQGFPAAAAAVAGLALALSLAVPPTIAAEPPPAAVRTLVLEPPAAQATRRFFGRIAARDTLDLAFEVGGRLVSLDAPQGARLAAGTPLAELDAAPFERAVARAELALAQAERDFSRAATLAERDAASRARADDAATARDLAALALEEAREALGHARLAAPFDALVAARLAPAFAFVEPGQAVLRLHDMSRVDVVFELPERLLTEIGDVARARFVAELPGVAAPVPLTLVEIRAEADRIGQTFTVTLALPDAVARDPRLVPGASASVVASVPADAPGIAVPASALVSGPDRDAALFVLEGEEPAIARRRPVTVRSQTGTGFLVEGVEPGVEIVAAGAHRVSDGQKVRRWTGLVVEER